MLKMAVWKKYTKQHVANKSTYLSNCYKKYIITISHEGCGYLNLLLVDTR